MSLVKEKCYEDIIKLIEQKVIIHFTRVKSAELKCKIF